MTPPEIYSFRPPWSWTDGCTKPSCGLNGFRLKRFDLQDETDPLEPDSFVKLYQKVFDLVHPAWQHSSVERAKTHRDGNPSAVLAGSSWIKGHVEADHMRYSTLNLKNKTNHCKRFVTENTSSSLSF